MTTGPIARARSRAARRAPPGEERGGGEPPLHPSARSLRGLDWFIFFVADVQTGFGPFVSVYLTTQKWTQVDIGLVLSAAGFVSLIGQMPGGALVDAARSERFVGGIAVAAICVSALAYAALPIFPVVLSASILHALASCVLGPAMAAISLGLVGQAMLGERLGRNARFASIGNAVAAAAMGACGWLLSARAVFVVTVLLLIPALLGAARDRTARDRSGTRARRAAAASPRPAAQQTRRSHAQPPAAHLRRLPVAVSSCQCSNVAADGQRADDAVGPLGRNSDRGLHRRAAARRRRLVADDGQPRTALGPAAVAADRLRRLADARHLFAAVTNPEMLVVVQLLDGVTAAVFSVMVPLVVADLTRGTGHFNLGQGIVGTFVGIGASLSSTFAGYISDRFGSPCAFAALAAIACAGLAVLWLLMPETRPAVEEE